MLSQLLMYPVGEPTLMQDSGSMPSSLIHERYQAVYPFFDVPAFCQAQVLVSWQYIPTGDITSTPMLVALNLQVSAAGVSAACVITVFEHQRYSASSSVLACV